MKYLLDTNVFRELGKTRPHPNVGAWLRTVDDADLSISALTIREITKGIAKLRRTKPDVANDLADAVGAILDSFDGRILPIDRQVAAAWGVALASHDKHIDDAGLAATASVLRLTLVTRNTQDFIGRGVNLLDPFKLPARQSR